MTAGDGHPEGGRVAARSPLVLGSLGVCALLLLMLGFASIGNPFRVGATAVTLVEIAVRSGLPAAVYLLGAIGLGRAMAPLWRGSGDGAALSAGLGLAIMLSLSHLLGVLGVLGMSGVGRGIAIALPAAGLLLLGRQVLSVRAGARDRGRAATLWWGAAAGMPALALLLVAASSPPGWLWESEGRGYDALSYHLQLPQEWLAIGRVTPVDHNVYSYLPSYIEAAFYHIGVMTGAGNNPAGLVSGEGYGLLAGQWLHAGIAVLGAWMLARLVAQLAEQIADQQSGPEGGAKSQPRAAARGALAGALAGALYLSIPWVIVTGSLAYNDLGVAALLGAALISATDGRMPAARRGVITGVLIGAACGVKPTALLLAGVPAGIALLAWSPRREWLSIVLAGALAGVAMLAPWLIRNFVHAGNPVFPFAASVFGHGHWTLEQAVRYGEAHRFDGTLLERLQLLALPDAHDPAGARHRGMLHPQWSVFFPLVLVAAAAMLAIRPVRRPALWLLVMLLAQLTVWLFATHIQSRFLLPMAVPGTALFGVAVWWLMARNRMALPAACGAVLIVVSMSILLYSREPGRVAPGSKAPGAGEMLVPGPGVRSGEVLRGQLGRATPAERREIASALAPEAFVNLMLPTDSVVLLVGEATPLYYTRPVHYATTWDRSLLAEAILIAPASPAQWAGYLRGRGITHVLVNTLELERLDRSGFLDSVLEPASVRGFLEGQTTPVQAWPGVLLHALNTGGHHGGEAPAGTGERP